MNFLEPDRVDVRVEGDTQSLDGNVYRKGLGADTVGKNLGGVFQLAVNRAAMAVREGRMKVAVGGLGRRRSICAPPPPPDTPISTF